MNEFNVIKTKYKILVQMTRPNIEWSPSIYTICHNEQTRIENQCERERAHYQLKMLQCIYHIHKLSSLMERANLRQSTESI